MLSGICRRDGCGFPGAEFAFFFFRRQVPADVFFSVVPWSRILLLSQTPFKSLWVFSSVFLFKFLCVVGICSECGPLGVAPFCPAYGLTRFCRWNLVAPAFAPGWR